MGGTLGLIVARTWLAGLGWVGLGWVGFGLDLVWIGVDWIGLGWVWFGDLRREVGGGRREERGENGREMEGNWKEGDVKYRPLRGHATLKYSEWPP